MTDKFSAFNASTAVDYAASVATDETTRAPKGTTWFGLLNTTYDLTWGVTFSQLEQATVDSIQQGLT